MSRILLCRAVLGLGAALIAGGLLLMEIGYPLGVGLRLAVPGLFLIAAVIGERWRYTRLESEPSDSGWIATDERFVDPESGKLVTVFYRPATGERRYVSGLPAEGPPLGLGDSYRNRSVRGAGELQP